jgi:carbon storage regulator
VLVIRRRAGEGLVVTCPNGERLEVELLDIEGSQVKLGFKAPREVRVMRREIAETEFANQQAARPPAAVAFGRLQARLRSNAEAPPPSPGDSPSNPSRANR